MMIGATARIGTVCEATIQGIRLASTLRRCTIAIASAMPSSEPRAKPVSVAERVTQAWVRRLRFEPSGIPAMLRHSSEAT